MKSRLYRISQENFDTILAYYNITKEKAEKYCNYIIKYKEYTKDYYLNIKQLFNKEENVSDLNKNLKEYEEITIDYSNKTINNNKINITNNSNNSNSKIKKDINILPIQHIIDKFNKFFNYQMQCLQLFIDSIDTPLNQIHNIIEQTQSEINNIKNEFFIEKQNFCQKFSEFDSLNKKLKIDCCEGERKLVEYSLKKKSLDSKDWDKEKQLENETNLKIIDIKKNQKTIFEKFKGFDDFGKKFYDFTNEKINELKSKTSSLFKEFEKCLNNILIFYKKLFFLPIKEISILEKKINNINEFDDLLNNNIKEIDEKKYNINFDEYQIKIIKNNEVDKDEVYEERKSINDTLKDFSYEITEEEKEQLQEEDIFFIVKKMYNFNYVNKKNFNINIEKEKLKLKEKIDKLTIYANYRTINKINIINNNNINIFDEVDNYDDHNDLRISTNIVDNIYEIDKEEKPFNKDEEITEEEVNYLCKSMNVREYRSYFLSKINNFRAIGAFNMPVDTFNNFVRIFRAISNNFYINVKEKEDNDKIKKILDLQIAKLTIILSQTFYCLKNGQKVYIQNELNNEIYQSEEFWKQLLKLNIEDEIEICKKNDKVNDKINDLEDEKTIKNRKNRISFAQLIPQIGGMYGFGLKKETIKKIILPFFDEFNINEENQTIINQVIENPSLI